MNTIEGRDEPTTPSEARIKPECASGSVKTHRWAVLLAAGGLLWLAYEVLEMFLAPMAWAAIMAHAAWPLHVRIRRALGGRPMLGAAVTTLLLTAAVVVPMLALLVAMKSEVASGYAALSGYLAGGRFRLPSFISAVPWLGDGLQELLDQYARDPGSLRHRIGAWAGQRTGDLLEVLGGVGRNVSKAGFATVALLFLLRDGEALVDQLKRLLGQALSDRSESYLRAAGTTVRAIMYGLAASALAQGMLAGFGYWMVGLDAPVAWAALTAAVALIPWGTPLVWVPLGIWLMLTGRPAAAMVLLVWGMVAVSWIDNLLRPVVISKAAQVPFLLVMFGVLGGVAAFGLVGLFVGPVVLALALTLWREWLGSPVPGSVKDPA